MVKERRCNLYDDHGRPRRMKDGTLGCFKDASVCRFAHPHERDWETANPSYPPRHGSVLDADSDFFYILMQPDRRDRENKRDRERESLRDTQKRKSSSFIDSPPRRRDSATTRASPGPPSTRRPNFEGAMDGSGATKRGRSPALSVLSSTSDQLERLRKDNARPGRTSDHSRRNFRPHSGSRERDRDRGPKPPYSSHGPNTPSTDTPSLLRPSTIPPEPSKPPPMQPPPPPILPEVPRAPSFVPIKQPASSAGTAPRELKELSMDEQRLAWHERIDLMYTSITSRRDYTKLESDLSHISMLSNSSIVNDMPEADRARICAQKSALELQIEDKRKEVNDTIQKLLGSNFWPFLRTPQISQMEKTLEDVKKHVTEVRSLLDTVKNSSTALFKTTVLELPPNSDRPSKRRKLDGGADTPGPPTTGDTAFATEETAKELEAFRDKLTELERHVVDLENDIAQRDGVISDEIELHIDARLEEEDALYSPVEEPGEVPQSEIEAVVDMKSHELVRAVSKTGEEIGVLAIEVAELITKVNTLEAKCAALEAENLEFKNKLAQDSLDHARSQDALARRDQEIDAIAAALQAFISQAPAGQTPGDLPSAEYIVGSLRSHLDGLLRDKFGATMVKIQQEVFDKVQESHNRTLDTVSPKIMLLLKMINLITSRLGQPDMEAVNGA